MVALICQILKTKAMNETSTNENLILYYFNETDLAKTVMVQRAIDVDVVVRDEFEEIKSVFSTLDELISMPSEHSIDSIMAYSQLTASLS